MMQACEDLSRRAFLTKTTTAVAGLATGAAVGNAIFGAGFGADAELIRLGAELDRVWAEETAVYSATETKGDIPPEHERERDAASAVSAAVVDRIGKLQATTLPGFRVKARAFHWCSCGEPLDEASVDDQGTVDAWIAATILRDLLALPGA